MRSLLTALVVVGLLAAPSLGMINIKLTADKTTIDPGETTTIRMYAMGTVAGVSAAAGYVGAAGPAGTLQAVPNSFVWDSFFTSPPPFGSKVGTAGANGGWGTVGDATTGFGSQQVNYLFPDVFFGRAEYVKLASYQVSGVAAGTVTLTVIPATIGGFKFVETNKTSVFGTNLPVAITVTPEPATMALLALAGLLASRRRR